jgi:hypothetical protein
MSEHQFVGLLKQRGKFNFLYELVTAADQLGHDKLANTVELFTFGDWNHYGQYKSQYIELDNELTAKLIDLTLISISNRYDNDVISLEEVYSQFGIRDFDTNIIDLVDNNVIDVKIDDANKCLRFGTALTLRDSFDSTMYTLKVLSLDDLPRSFQHASSQLQSWYNDKLAPVKQDLDTSLVKRAGSNSRKRKTPEIV